MQQLAIGKIASCCAGIFPRLEGMFSDWFEYFWEQIINPGVVQPELFNIPWMWIVMQPLRLIGAYPAVIIIQGVSIYIIIRLGLSLKISTWRMVLVILSAPVGCNFLFGQLDGLMIAAYLLPPAYAAILALFKPQTSLWAGWDALRKQPWLILPLAILVISAFLIWRWPLSTSDPKGLIQYTGIIPPIFYRVWNWSLFPFSLLLIPWLLRGGKKLGLLITPFLFPYTGLQSLIGPILTIASDTPWWLFLIVWLFMWLRFAWLLNFL